jgi:hypothetical protein
MVGLITQRQAAWNLGGRPVAQVLGGLGSRAPLGAPEPQMTKRGGVLNGRTLWLVEPRCLQIGDGTLKRRSPTA